MVARLFFCDCCCCCDLDLVAAAMALDLFVAAAGVLSLVAPFVVDAFAFDFFDGGAVVGFGSFDGEFDTEA